jgi:hypothetical protein
MDDTPNSCIQEGGPSDLNPRHCVLTGQVFWGEIRPREAAAKATCLLICVAGCGGFHLLATPASHNAGHAVIAFVTGIFIDGLR